MLDVFNDLTVFIGGKTVVGHAGFIIDHGTELWLFDAKFIDDDAGFAAAT